MGVGGCGWVLVLCLLLLSAVCVGIVSTLHVYGLLRGGLDDQVGRGVWEEAPLKWGFLPDRKAWKQELLELGGNLFGVARALIEQSTPLTP